MARWVGGGGGPGGAAGRARPSDAPGPRRPLNATAASLLGFLHDGPMTGWDLVVTAQDRIGAFWTLTQSQVYRELATMVADGLVEVGPPGPRERKPHAITAAGRAAFAGWLDREPGPDQVRIPLLLTIAFARHLPAERLAEIIASRRTEHAERLAGYRAARDALGGTGDDERTRRATLEFGLRHEQAVLDWFDLLPELLGGEAP
jgi:DNA-binding PadR family transcriptional regulator